MSRKPNGNPKWKVLSFIDEYIQRHGFSPAFRDICEGTDIKSSSHVSKILAELCSLGWIVYEGRKSRSLQILPAGRRFLREQAGKPAIQMRVAAYVNEVANIAAAKLSRPIDIRVLGNTFAALPTMVPVSDFSMYDYESMISVSRDVLPSGAKSEDMFALEVRGQSMIEAHINDGDFIIVQRAETASNGDMVVVWLDDENATTLKYFYRRESHFELKPANPTMRPIIINSERPLRIIGKVVKVVRL